MSADTRNSLLEEVFVGRANELEEMRVWASLGLRGPLLLLGQVGSGKTTLIAHFARELRAEGRAVIGNPGTRELGQFLRAVVAGLRRERGTKRALIVLDDMEEMRGTPAEWSELAQMVYDRGQYAPYMRSEREFDGRTQWLLAGKRIPSGLERQLDGEFVGRRLRVLTLAGLDDQELREMVFRLVRERERLSESDLTVLATILGDRLGGNPFLVRTAISAALGSGSVLNALKALDERSNLALVAGGEKFSVRPATELPMESVQSKDGKIWTATPHLYLPNGPAKGRAQIRRFEDLINQPNVRESDIQAFFEEHSQFLRGRDYSRVVAHPVLERLHPQGDLIPDFFLQASHGDFADVLDLKLPAAPLIVGTKDRLRFSKAVHDAIAQVREYRDYFEDAANRKRVQDRYGLTSYRPTVAIVIGTSDLTLPAEKRKQIFEDVPSHTRVLTYDQLLAKMRRQVDMLAT